MKTLFTLYDKKNKKILFGYADKGSEVQDVLAFRYKIYLEKGHINPNKNKIDKDYFDENKLCRYYVAKSGNRLIGTLRVIYSHPSPTPSLFFDFSVPEKLKKIKNANILEIGRLISRPYLIKDKLRIAKHLVPLGLFYAVSLDSFNKNFLAGYGSVKESVYKKIRLIGLPFYRIPNAKMKQLKKGIAGNFFDSDNDPPIAIYYLAHEVRDYLIQLFSNGAFFKILDSKNIMLKWRFMIYIFYIRKFIEKLIRSDI